jgi:hypothetical protein
LGDETEESMRDPDVDRVYEDLAAMRMALGFQSPFEREHVVANLSLAVVGAVVAALTAWTNVSSIPTTRGTAEHWMYICLVIFPAPLVLGTMALVARRRRDSARLFWRESRRAWPVAAVVGLLYLGFTAWAVSRGAAAGTITASTLFLAGLYLLATALAARGLRHTLGWAVATMAAGLIAPSGTYQLAGLLVGGWLIAGGLSSAAVMAWQLRNRSKHGTH